MKFSILFVLLSFINGAIAFGQNSSDRFQFPEPHSSELKKNLTLWATEYHIHQAKAVANGFPLLDKFGHTLGVELTYDDWCNAALEGTVGVKTSEKNWSVFNYDSRAETTQVDCSRKFPRLPQNVRVAMGKTRFVAPQGQFGNGYDGLIIQPYRSLAVDISVFPLRQVVYIPQARGITFTTPTGETVVHDGYFFTADKGGAIKGNHIDVFIGLSEKNPFSFIKSRSDGTFNAYIVSNPEIEYQLLHSHTP